MTFAEVHVKRSAILTDRLGPDILLVLTMKRQVLHRERAHCKFFIAAPNFPKSVQQF